MNLNRALVTLRQHHRPKRFCLGKTAWDMCTAAQPPCLDVTELAATKADCCAVRKLQFCTVHRLQPEANRLVRCASAWKLIPLCWYANRKMLCMLCRRWINDIRLRDTMLVCVWSSGRVCLLPPSLPLSLSLSLRHLSTAVTWLDGFCCYSR